MTLDPNQLIERELSWLEFNRRVLAEGMDPETPLLERLKFVGITSSNFDEFFMVRVPSLNSQGELLGQVIEKSREIIRIQNEYFENTLVPALEAAGIARVLPQFLSERQREYSKNIFLKEFFPLLTPLALRQGAPVPVLNNLSIHLAFRLKKAESQEEKFLSVVEVPKQLPRLVSLASEGKYCFILIEDLIYSFAEFLFPGYQIDSWGLFRLTRESELTFDEEKDEDFAKVMAEALRDRRENRIIRFESALPTELLAELQEKLECRDTCLSLPVSWLDLKSISQLAFQGSFREYKNPQWKPYLPEVFESSNEMWKNLRESDLLIHCPYDSFEAFSRFLAYAAEDPDVLMIKQTLYRTAHPSVVTSALERAVENGKQVTVLVELKARFDEDTNIRWADRLRRAGALVLYGIAGFKVHSKACLIVRREADGIRRYLHLGTGNYNEKTAQIYSDLGYFTTDEKLTSDAVLFFNCITGYSNPTGFSKIEMSPYGLKRTLLRLIQREALHSSPEKPGLIIAKMNSLVDPDIIEALYNASQAGVEIRLNVRGICCLRPGVKGLSETITVRSIVDMFLEHARIFYFQNNGDEEVYLSSADWMPRNLERRIEVMFPIDVKKYKKELIELLKLYLKDNVKAWRLLETGAYEKITPAAGEKRFRAQEVLCKRALEKQTAEKAAPKELKPQKPKD